MKIITLLIIFFTCNFTALTQTAALQLSFEEREEINTIKGIKGKALDLGNVSDRISFDIKNPLENEDSFTINVWVRGDLNAISSYNILSSITIVERKGEGWKPKVLNGIVNSEKDDFNGWKIGMQENGAWSFTAKGDSFTYEYKPTQKNQSIRDGHWHLLTVSYESKISELRFYFDGEQVAIYHAPELKSMIASDSLVIGNSLDSEHDYKEKEWDTFYGQIDEISVYKQVQSAAEISDYFQELTGATLSKNNNRKPETLRVSAFNIFHGGNESGKDIGRERIIELMKEDGAEVFTLIETYGSGELLADALGYYFYLISTNLSILSKYPIGKTFRVYKPFHAGGAEIILGQGKSINVFTVWLNHLPSYRNLLFENENIDLGEFLADDSEKRGVEMNTILEEIAPYLSGSDQTPVIIGGDFNSGSHLDWIEEAKELHNNYVVPWPVSLAAAKVGLIDSYRKVNPDPVEYPGFTFSLRNNNHTYLKDRIDYIYFKGDKIKPISSRTIKEHSITFPSDHAGVSTLFKLIE